jgi:hypothetical protein
VSELVENYVLKHKVEFCLFIVCKIVKIVKLVPEFVLLSALNRTDALKTSTMFEMSSQKSDCRL